MIRVLIVGQGAPTTGGIPSFVADVLGDPWLRARVRLDFLNTSSHRRGSPGAATVGNARLALTHARQTFARARDVDVVHLNVAPAPALPLLRAIVLCAAVGFGLGAAVGATVPLGIAGVFVGAIAGIVVVARRFSDL